MGALVAIAIIWYLCWRATDEDDRKRQKKINKTVTGFSLLWFLDGIFNADKHQKY